MEMGVLTDSLGPGGCATMTTPDGRLLVVHDYLLAPGQIIDAGRRVVAHQSPVDLRHYVTAAQTN